MKKSYRRKDPLEALEQKIRELKAENRQLHKRLKKITKGYKSYLDNEDLEDDSVTEERQPEKKICWDCNTGVLQIIIIGNRRFRKCDNQNCGKKTKVKII
jgi:hypothetical protein